MAQYIEKDALVAKIEDKINKYTKRGEESDAKHDGHGMYWGGVISCLNEIRSLLDTLEVKEVMPALDNGKMPIERWREAVQAASNQANYRKRQGLTETCDDYFVDGVQWADEHPIVTKEANLMIHTIIAECCDWLAMRTNLSHDEIEGCRNLMLTVKEEQCKAQKGE